MSELMWIKSHVEQLVEREWDVCRAQRDADGDYPYRGETSACWVSVMDTEPIMVRVFAHAAVGLKPTAKLLRELNDIQGRCLTVRVHHHGAAVIVSQTISPVNLTQPVLAQAVGLVMAVADDIGPLLAAMFDGTTPLTAESSDVEAP